jgi:hypothetical protein
MEVDEVNVLKPGHRIDFSLTSGYILRRQLIVHLTWSNTLRLTVG